MSDRTSSESLAEVRDTPDKPIKPKCPIFLENYSPNRVSDYNLIECVWPSMKKYIANAMFKSIEEPEYLLHQL